MLTKIKKSKKSLLQKSHKNSIFALLLVALLAITGIMYIIQHRVPRESSEIKSLYRLEADLKLPTAVSRKVNDSGCQTINQLGFGGTTRECKRNISYVFAGTELFPTLEQILQTTDNSTLTSREDKGYLPALTYQGPLVADPIQQSRTYAITQNDVSSCVVLRIWDPLEFTASDIPGNYQTIMTLFGPTDDIYSACN